MFTKTSANDPPRSTWLDRAISWASPERGAKRAAWRTFEASYKGGVPTRTSEMWAQAQGFRFGLSSERQQVIDTRSRAYQAYDNNPIAKALVQTERDHVIGDGLNYQPTTESAEWNREAEERYYLWLEDCSVRGRDAENGSKLQGDIFARSRIAGDIGWIFVKRDYVDDRGVLITDSRIQVVSAENICTPDGRWSDPTMFDGIQFDTFGKPQAFHVLSQDERGVTRKFIEIPARDFVWFPHTTKFNQARPPSCFVTVFDLLAHLDRYIDGVSLAAWMATVMGIVFKQNNAGKQVSQLGSLTNSQGAQQKAITFENGMVKYIGTDEEVAQVQAHQPMHQTPDFIRAMLRLVGQPFDMPLEVIAKDMSTCNFASARIGLLPFYRSCRYKAAWFASHWSRTIQWWLSREKNRAPGDPKKWKTKFPDNYWKHDLLPNSFEYTDPISEAQSDLLQTDAGFKSPQMVIAERGRDAEKILRERREWMEKTKDLPVVNSTLTRHPQNGVGAQGDPLGHEQVEPPKPKPPAQPNKPSDATAMFQPPFQPVINFSMPPQQASTPNVNVTLPEQTAPVVNFSAAPVTVHMPEYPIQPAALAPVVNVESPSVTLNVPEQPASVVNVSPPQVTVNVPENAPVVNVTLPEQSVQPAPVVNVSVPEQPAPVVNVTTPEQPASNVTVNVPDQVAPIVNVTTPDNAPVINVSTPPVTVNVPDQASPQVSVHLPDQPAPVVNVTLPDAAPAQVTINVPEASPVVNVAPAQVSVTLPEQPATIVNVDAPVVNVQPPEVTVNVPSQDAPVVNVNVPAQAAPTVNVTLPDQPAPQVMVSLPEQPAPTVTVNVPEPKRRKVTKHITHDPKTKRIIKVEEQEE